jgi:hypothetical protein
VLAVAGVLAAVAIVRLPGTLLGALATPLASVSCWDRRAPLIAGVD